LTTPGLDWSELRTDDQFPAQGKRRQLGWLAEVWGQQEHSSAPVATDSERPDGKLRWCRMERDGAAVMLEQACDEEDGRAAQRGRGVEFFFNCDDAMCFTANWPAMVCPSRHRNWRSTG